MIPYFFEVDANLRIGDTAVLEAGDATALQVHSLHVHGEVHSLHVHGENFAFGDKIGEMQLQSYRQQEHHPSENAQSRSAPCSRHSGSAC